MVAPTMGERRVPTISEYTRIASAAIRPCANSKGSRKMFKTFETSPRFSTENPEMLTVRAPQIQSAASGAATRACTIPISKVVRNLPGRVSRFWTLFARSPATQAPAALLKAAQAYPDTKNGLRLKGSLKATADETTANAKPQKAPANSRKLRALLLIATYYSI